MYKKIDVFIDGKYLWSTNSHKRCMDAVQHAKDFFTTGKIDQVNAFRKKYNLDKLKITAFFDRRIK